MSIDLRSLIMETDRPTYRGVKQRGQILEYKNFDYRKHQTDGNRVYYRCAERNKYGCKATLAIGKETGIVLRETGEHCHDSDLMVKKVKKYSIYSH